MTNIFKDMRATLKNLWALALQPEGRGVAEASRGYADLQVKLGEHHSVLQDWVMQLPLRHQGTLLTNMRSCDLSPKHPACIDERYGCSTGEQTADRQLTAFLRWAVLNPADDRETGIAGAFMQPLPPDNWKPSQFGHYPLHWFSHLMHGFQIVGAYHPDPDVGHRAAMIYQRLVHSLHLNVETREQMDARLTEDRIANKTVVS